MSVDLSTEGTAGFGAGAAASETGFLPASACAGLFGWAVLTGAVALLVLTGGRAFAGNFAAISSTDFFALPAASFVATAGRATFAGTAFDSTDTGFETLAVFFAAGATVLTAFADLPADLTGWTGLDTAFALTDGLAAACAATIEFLTGAFNVCLLSEAA